MGKKGKSCGAGGSPAVVSGTGVPPVSVRYHTKPERIVSLGRKSPLDGLVLEDSGTGVSPVHSSTDPTRTGETPVPLNCIYRDDAHGIWLYQGNCLAILDAISVKYPEGCFDMIFADPPYFLSNGGITCHAGRMVKVDKGECSCRTGSMLI